MQNSLTVGFCFPLICLPDRKPLLPDRVLLGFACLENCLIGCPFSPDRVLLAPFGTAARECSKPEEKLMNRSSHTFFKEKLACFLVPFRAPTAGTRRQNVTKFFLKKKKEKKNIDGKFCADGSPRIPVKVRTCSPWPTHLCPKHPEASGNQARPKKKLESALEQGTRNKEQGNKRRQKKTKEDAEGERARRRRGESAKVKGREREGEGERARREGERARRGRRESAKE